MKWTKTQHSERLNIAHGLIHASIQWDILYSKGYKATVNSEEIGIYPNINEAKAEVEKFIKHRLRLAVNEIGGLG